MKLVHLIGATGLCKCAVAESSRGEELNVAAALAKGQGWSSQAAGRKPASQRLCPSVAGSQETAAQPELRLTCTAVRGGRPLWSERGQVLIVPGFHPRAHQRSQPPSLPLNLFLWQPQQPQRDEDADAGDRERRRPRCSQPRQTAGGTGRTGRTHGEDWEDWRDWETLRGLGD